MADADFCRTMLRHLKVQAEATAKRYPRLRHMLVLPPGEGLLLASCPGVRPARCRNEKPTSITSFGKSQIVGTLPPEDCWPDGFPPLRAVAAEQDFVPFRPLAQEPFRIHLFFGDSKGMHTLETLSESLMDIAGDVDQALKNCRGTIFWHSNDCIHGNRLTALDDWLCTLHWWAWKATDLPIATRPKVVVGKVVVDCDHMDRAVTERMAFSLLNSDVFSASVAVIGLIDRLFDAPPDLIRDLDFPDPIGNVNTAIRDEAEPASFEVPTASDDPSLRAATASAILERSQGNAPLVDGPTASNVERDGTPDPVNEADAKTDATANSNRSVAAEPAVNSPQSNANHSLDFRSVNWFGTMHSFTPNQAAVVKVLWESWKQGTPDVGDNALLEAAESDSTRISVLFLKHPAWRTMIVPGQTKGTRRLAEPAA